MSIEFLITTFIVVASPGTGVIYTLAAGLSRGARASVLAAFACTLGIIPHMAAAITGLAALLYTSALAFEIIKYLGVAYLLYMAWAMWNEKGAGHLQPGGRSSIGIACHRLRHPDQHSQSEADHLLLCVPAAIREHQRAACPATHAGAECRLHAGHARRLRGVRVFAASVRNQVVSRPRVTSWMHRVFAGSFVALSARLALTDR